MKKLFVIGLGLVVLTVISAPSFDAAGLIWGKQYYDEYCGDFKYTVSSNGGSLTYGQNTVGIDESISWFKANTSVDYKAATYKPGTGTVYGPRVDDNATSKSEVAFKTGNQKHGSYKYN